MPSSAEVRASGGGKRWENGLVAVDALWFDEPTAVLLCEERPSEFQKDQESDEDSDGVHAAIGRRWRLPFSGGLPIQP
jgi:hypothetical protein